MIIKLASFFKTPEPSFMQNAIKKVGLGNFAQKLSKNPDLANKIKNASLVGTIAAGDGIIKASDPNSKGHRVKAFGRGAVEGAVAGTLIAGADQAIDTLAHHGAHIK